ncbi:zinc finger CCCH domain-containing protein 18-like isoform X2 [Hydractinia symbiolongicarpus]|uniref:zinc finger CCCH domain-containing protein 18-like isoform X2 n=1 Tax=Hydractinia symbiolongicarpus TaxID=13093 RepID=UPI0025519246|nr:zinc finger CCCH domain-containing protein 18-like isoform X2 [Hydractinia symbiolongicarpus]
MDENKNKGDLLQKEVKSSEKEMKDDKIHTYEDDLPEIKNGEDANDVIRSKSENGNVDTSKCEDTEDINDQVNKSKSNNMVVNTERDTSETKNSEEVTNEVDKSEDKTEPEIVGEKDTEISQSKNNNPATESSNNEILEVKNGNDENLSVLSSEPVESNTINSKESETKKARNDDNIEITGELSQTTTDETKEIEKEEEIKDDVKDLKTESTESNTSRTNVAPVIELRHMLEDIEEGELDYDEEDTDMGDGVEDLPDLPEYDPSANDKGDPGEIVSDKDNDEEREEGEIADDEDDEGGQVYICVDPLNDKWKKMSKADQKDLEEGQIEDDDEVKKVSPKLPSPGRFIPRTLCKYYKNGLCRWGSTCRFLHPGVNDQGIPSDVQPTWNATAGNYVMHRPPGMYPNAFGKAPPPMECINVPVMPAPVVDMSLLSTVGHAEIVAVPVAGAVYPEEMPVRRESAWEKGLRRAKEIKEAGARRRREDADFEKKKLSMRITETVHDESNYEPVPAYPGEKTYDEWNIDDYGKSVDYPEHRHRDERRSRYSDRFSRTPKEPSLDRSSGRARIAELPSSHPMRREERQRLRERERREKAEKNDVEPEREFRRDPNTQIKISSKSMSSKVNVTDPRVRSSFKQTSNNSVKTPLKTTEPTEWHDPWMRTQQTATAQLPKTDLINKSGVEAISDSDSSSSDSDSDSDSSSSSKSSGSKSVGHSSGSDTEKRSKHNYSSSGSKVSDSTRKEPRPFQQQSEEKSGKVGKSSEKNEPLSYEEWKRLQTIQKAQYHQQMANQYKNNLGGGEAPGRDNSSDRHKERYMKQSSRIEEDKRNTYPNNQRPLSSTLPGRHEQISKPAVKTSCSLPPKDISMVNDDKFDSPKRRATQSDSDSGSDSDSASDSDSSGSDSDSDDTDSDSDSDTAMPSAPPSAPSGNNKTGSSIKFGQMDAFAKKVALAEKFGGFSQDPLKFPSGEVKPVEAPVSTLAGKRPARKDELLKELKAVEDAIARKRAKID